VHLDIHTHADEDLDRLWETDPNAAAAVQVVLEQLEADPKAIDKLTTYGDNVIGRNRVNVKPWETAKKKGNLWRFRVFDTPATSYRVVYGYHWQTRQICVLAIIHKDKFDYDDLSNSLAQRILADWRAL
jgi:mRNA-degrading endonuclease RelE of RelBE toxin-antitoxin system